MNRYLKEFLHRGLLFGGFGPIILGVVYAILQTAIENFSLDGVQTLVATVSVYLLAFLQAGASVFNQIEHWSLPKATLCHFSTLYVAYVSCYLVNSWIPFDTGFLAIFTAVFAAVYLGVWLAVAISVKAVSRKLNEKIKS